MAFFSENLKFSTVDHILTKIMVYFEDKTNRKKKKKTAALLLYTQLEHNKIILQEHLLQVFVYYYVVFQAAHHCSFRRTSLLSTSTINSRTVLCQFHAKDRLKYNQTVTEKFEQCCKVTDNTVMVVIFTVDVNNDIIKMKYNVPPQKRPCLHANEILPPTI